MRFGGVQNSTRYRRAKPLSVIKGLSTSGPSSETFTSLCIARLRARLAGLCMPARLVSQIRTTLNCSIDLASSNAALVKIRLLVTFEPPKMTAFIGSPNGSFFTITDQWPNARTVIGFFQWKFAHVAGCSQTCGSSFYFNYCQRFCPSFCLAGYRDRQSD